MLIDWKILLGVELAQLYLEMTNVAWVEWVTGTATFQAGAQVLVVITLLTGQTSPIWESGVAYPHFLYYKRGNKVGGCIGRVTFLPSGKVNSCLLFITLIKLWQVSGCFCSLLTARTEYHLTIEEFILSFIESLDLNSETSRDLPPMTIVSSFSPFCILFPRG